MTEENTRKKKYVKELGAVLSKYVLDVEGFTYDENREVIEVRFINGYCREVNVACDSYTAMLVDLGHFFERY